MPLLTLHDIISLRFERVNGEKFALLKRIDGFGKTLWVLRYYSPSTSMTTPGLNSISVARATAGAKARREIIE